MSKLVVGIIAYVVHILFVLLLLSILLVLYMQRLLVVSLKLCCHHSVIDASSFDLGLFLIHLLFSSALFVVAEKLLLRSLMTRRDLTGFEILKIILGEVMVKMVIIFNNL